MAAINKKNRGASMIEVLVAVLVLSVGLLGVAQLQATALRFGNDALTRSKSTDLAYTIIEVMHSFAQKSGSIDKFVGESPATAPACENDAAGNEEKTLKCWQRLVMQELPGGTTKISKAPNTMPTGSYLVELSWYDRESESNVSQSWVTIP